MTISYLEKKELFSPYELLDMCIFGGNTFFPFQIPLILINPLCYYYYYYSCFFVFGVVEFHSCELIFVSVMISVHSSSIGTTKWYTGDMHHYFSWLE